MGINPAMGMGFGGDDFYTQMLYQQMMNGGTNWANAANGTTNGTNGSNGTNNAQQKTDATQKGGGLGTAFLYGAGAAGATAAGMYFTNNPFNSALEPDKKVFNKNFMRHFAGEYAAMQNGDNLEKFFKGLSNSKTPITAENYATTMDSIEEFIKSGDVDDLTAEAKQVLKKKFGLSKVDKAALEGLRNTKLADMKTFFTKTQFKFADLGYAHNLNAQQGLLDSLDDIREGWKSLGKGKDSIPARLDFLRENAYAMGMEEADYAKLLRNADDISDVKELEAIFKKFGVDARKKALNKEITDIEKAMQKFATKWDGKAGFFGKSGFKKFGNPKQLGALDNALSAMRRGKAGKWGLIAGLGAAGLALICNA